LLDDLERRVGELIDDLPEKEKAVLLMKKMGGMTYQAIGIMQGFSDRYAKKLVRKALDTISAVLEEEDYLKGGRLNYA